jgi:transposase
LLHESAWDPIYEDVAFAALFSTRGQPAEAPWRLALVTIMQYAEGLSDRQAADAVRSRIKFDRESDVLPIK